ADFVKFADGKVHIRMANGKVYQVPPSSFSKEDQEFIASQKSSPAASSSDSNSADWPNFRGPKMDGISPYTGLINSIPKDGPKTLWVYKKAGMGYSSYSIVGGKLYTMGTRGEDVTVMCVNTEDGSEIWSKSITEDNKEGYSAKWGYGPRSTPTVSDGMVYAIGPKGYLACLSAEDGKKKWSKHLVDDFGGKMGGWGFSASPLVDGDNLIIAPGGGDTGLVALNKKTGAVVWKCKDVKPGLAESAPIVPAEINGTRQYIRLFQSELVGVAAEDGKLLWTSPWEVGKTAVIPTPIVDGNQIYISSGYGAGCKLIEIGSDNTPKDIWQNKTMQNHHGGVIKVDDHLY
ncbi:MAG: PQQ-binding-like beta-propeller repeat protein, partial [Methylococcales bacterium]|nr:PQQ-binding-like beta-propeller repeat protein [Methylococcales bacterium]